MEHNLIIIDSRGNVRGETFIGRYNFSGQDLANAFKKSSSMLTNVTWSEKDGVIIITGTMKLSHDVKFIKIDY